MKTAKFTWFSGWVEYSSVYKQMFHKSFTSFRKQRFDLKGVDSWPDTISKLFRSELTSEVGWLKLTLDNVVKSEYGISRRNK